MDPNLFAKHFKHLQERQDSLSRIINHIQERTGILLQEEEVQLSKKTVRFMTSSAKRAALTRHHIEGILKDIGYSVSF